MAHETDDIRFLVRTKQGLEVPVMAGPEVKDLSWGQRQQLENEDPCRGRRRRGPDLTYNCHGMTFVNRMGWVGSLRVSPVLALSPHGRAPREPDRDVLDLLEGNGYRRTCSLPNYQVDPMPGRPVVEVGDIIVYINGALPRGGRISHSGIVVAVEEGTLGGRGASDIKVLSKMGMAGEYLHSFRDVPEAYGRTVEIWSDREDVR